MDAYASQHGPCICVIVSCITEAQKREFGFFDPSPGITFEFHQQLNSQQLNYQYQRASVLLHLARYESFGLPLIEAAAREVPVVATRKGVAGELLAAESIVNGDAPVACAEALAEAVRQRGELGGALKKAYQARYTREKMVDAYQQSLEGV
jgi:glycosyltransferase involved in cell wall biosynthesis